MTPIPSRWSLSAPERAVLLTLAYTDQFAYPLRLAELHHRLLGLELTAPLTQSQLLVVVAGLERRGLVIRADGFICLPGRQRTIRRRRQQADWAAQKQQQVAEVCRWASRVPWVTAVFVTGSQAVGSADQDSDLDFMIITQPRRLWLARIAISSYAQLRGKRRTWHGEEPNSWCFNLWLDQDHQTIPLSVQDSYRAYEVLQACEVWARPGQHGQFHHANRWAALFLPHGGWSPQSEATVQRPRLTATATSRLNAPHRSALAAAVTGSPAATGWGSKLWDALDWLAWRVQRWYMHRHQTTERVGRGFAFFHPRDTKRQIQRRWQRSVERCLPKAVAIQILQPYVGDTATRSVPSTHRAD